MTKILKKEPPIHVLIVDTNVLWLKDKGPAVNPEFDQFLLAHENLLRIEFVLPEVVRDELTFQHCSSAKRLIDKVADHVAEFSTITAKQHRHRLSEERMKKQVQEKFQRWLTSKNGRITSIPYAAIDWSELYRRSIWRIPPFAADEKNLDNEKGFRDALICETVVNIAKQELRDVNIVFVTNDFVLRTAVLERLEGDKKFLAFPTLGDFSSYIKLTREELTKDFIDKIVKRASEKFYSDGDDNCIWTKDNIERRLYGIRDAWLIPELHSTGSSPQAILTLSGLRSLGQAASPGWKLTKLNQWYVGPHEFAKTSGQRTYHWSTSVTMIRKYIITDGPNVTDERIHLVVFKVLWKADVKADARFNNIETEHVKLEKKEFRTPTQAEKERYSTDSYTTPI